MVQFLFVLQATFEIKVEEHVLAGRFNKIQEPLVFQINQPNKSTKFRSKPYFRGQVTVMAFKIG